MTPPAGLAAIAHAVAESAPVPLPEDQIMLIQTLIGAWPLSLAGGARRQRQVGPRPVSPHSSSASPRGS